MKFKTIYLDVTNKEELHLGFNRNDEAFFMPINQVEVVLSELRLVTDHLSFSLFHDVNEHPKIKEVFNMTCEHGFRFDVMFLSNEFIDNLDLYNNNAISGIEICIEALEQSNSLDTPDKCEKLNNALQTLATYGRSIVIDLPSRNKEDYQQTTLSFLDDLGFDLEHEDWKNGAMLNLSDSIAIRCCDRLKEPEHELLPKKILGRCHGAVTMLGVMSNGIVIPCNNVQGKRIVLGNIFLTPIADILNSKPFISISEGFYKNQLVHPVCQHCPYPRKIF